MESLQQFTDAKVQQYAPAPLCVSETARRQVIEPLCAELQSSLGRVEKLEGLLNRLIEGQGNPDAFETERIASRIASEARTLLADESKENEHGDNRHD